VKLDVQHFSPKELSIKTVDNFVIIEGKHDEKLDDHGFISRHFVRRYMLPEWAKAEDVACDMSSDGVMKVTVTKPTAALAVEGKEIPINFTGQPAAIAAPAATPACPSGGCHGDKNGPMKMTTD
jgi:crystallin alpha B